MAFRGAGGSPARGFGRGRGPGPVRPIYDSSLIKMVEEYLVANRQKSYIDMTAMGEHIRKLSYRYGRMQQNTFKNQLKQAYAEYSRQQAEKLQNYGRDIRFDEDNPLDDQSLSEMGGYPSSESDCESELHIDERDDIAGDTGVSQMKELYMSQSTPQIKADANKENGGRNTSQAKSSAPPTPSTSKAPVVVDCVSVSSGGSPAGPGTEKEKVVSEPVPPKAAPVAPRVDVDDDSGSDLEIIDEVKVPPSTNESVQNQMKNPNQIHGVIGTTIMQKGAIVITNASVSQQQHRQPIVQQQHRQQNVVQQQHSQPAQFRSDDSMRILPSTPAQIKKITSNSSPTIATAPSKGVKRKTEKSGDEIPTGINEDLTRKRPRKEVAVIRDTGYKLKDFAGSEKIVEEICKLVMHLKHPEIYQTLGVTPPRGFLLHGAPGTGKTLLANAIAGELSMPMLKVAGTELVSGISGESENNIRELFNQAVAVAPCIIFIDEIDSVTPRRENANKDMERRIVAQLLACIDDLANKEKGTQVLLIGATNRIESIDTALRRAGRFDREICLGIPDEKSREKILAVICRGVKLNADVSPSSLAKLTPGYVGADLQALVREAAVQAVNRKLFLESSQKSIADPDVMEVDNQNDDGLAKTSVKDQCSQASSSMNWLERTTALNSEELMDLFVCMKDYELALKVVQPSSKREGFATVPDITWDDIGALQDIRDELQVSILGPVKHAEAFKSLGLTTPAGVLLCGPPGCGKTLLAKAVANEAGINFISVKGPELLNMYVGESERAVRQCFLRARNSSPCVIFFDELDALCPRRSDVADSGSSGRIVNQLLTEMDGVEDRKGVFIMAATNRPDILDPAILRPGRLDKILFVNLPTPKDRFDILKALTKNSSKPTLADDVNLEEISNSPRCEDYTGADLAALVREASIAAFREQVLNMTEGPCPIDLKVHGRHFITAFSKTKPSVSKEDRIKYKLMAEKYSTIH